MSADQHRAPALDCPSGWLVYIVDAKPRAARSLAGPLMRAGCRTRVFQNPKTALSAFASAETKPDLLIADLLMPQINGLELADRCKRLHAALRVILTGWSLETKLLQHRDLGAVPVLDKPIYPAKLAAALEALGSSKAAGSAPDSDRPPASDEQATAERHGELREGRLVYIVDDKVRIAELVSSALRRLGCRTLVFHSPVAVAATLATTECKPTLLISDFSMPGMDGLELMRRCREVSPALKIILISGTVSAKALRGDGVGADFVLEKPLVLRDLVAAVKSLLGSGLEPTPAELPSPRSASLWDERPGSRPLVYVVDDEFVIAQMVARQLMRHGYRTRAFDNAALAFSSLQSANLKPVLLIADIEMPRVSGVELMRRCRQVLPGLRVILMSGSARVGTAFCAEAAAKPDGLLAKPFTPERLLVAVRALVPSPSTVF